MVGKLLICQLIFVMRPLGRPSACLQSQVNNRACVASPRRNDPSRKGMSALERVNLRVTARNATRAHDAGDTMDPYDDVSVRPPHPRQPSAALTALQRKDAAYRRTVISRMSSWSVPCMLLPTDFLHRTTTPARAGVDSPVLVWTVLVGGRPMPARELLRLPQSSVLPASRAQTPRRGL